jgi:pyruvate kinase
MTRRAKIVCSLGPATATRDRLRDLIEAGMDVARLNLGHGTHEDHAVACRLVREVAAQAGRTVGVLVDLQGPRIRLGRFAAGTVYWQPGETVVITPRTVLGGSSRASITYHGLAGDVRPGDQLLVGDGQVALRVSAITDDDVSCLVLDGGPVRDHQGISLPDVEIGVPTLTEKDTEDLWFGLGLGVDMVALSFVRSPADVKVVHAVMDEYGLRLPVLAKLEKPAAVRQLDDIIEAFDGVLVARGDLGVELPLDEIPLIQKRTIQRCRELAKPVIVATQMLDSMVVHPRPTRAEASDVANAVLDGADAVMLDAETSVGAYPVPTVRMMAKIVESAERHAPARRCAPWHEPATKGNAIAAAACDVAERLAVKAVCCFTQTGATARLLARHQPLAPLLAFTPDRDVPARLSLTWGVETFAVPVVRHTDEMVHQVQELLLSLGRFELGDLVLIVAGSPPGGPGTTNTMRLLRLGDRVLARPPGGRRVGMSTESVP